MKNKIEWTRIDSDRNGNPRYVCHFTDLINDADRAKIKAACAKKRMEFPNIPVFVVNDIYALACVKAKNLGGKPFKSSSYGGGIVFSTYNLVDLEKEIHQLNAVDLIGY